jgi:hypothetical protein
MEVKGKILKVLQEEKGQSKAGKDWFKSGFVIETFDQFPKTIALTVMSEKLMPVVRGLKIGEEVTVHINIESREYQDKYFTNVTAWRVDKATQGITNEPKTDSEPKSKVTDDDLPF